MQGHTGAIVTLEPVKGATQNHHWQVSMCSLATMDLSTGTVGPPPPVEDEMAYLDDTNRAQFVIFMTAVQPRAETLTDAQITDVIRTLRQTIITGLLDKPESEAARTAAPLVSRAHLSRDAVVAKCTAEITSAEKSELVHTCSVRCSCGEGKGGTDHTADCDVTTSTTRCGCAKAKCDALAEQRKRLREYELSAQDVVDKEDAACKVQLSKYAAPQTPAAMVAGTERRAYDQDTEFAMRDNMRDVCDGHYPSTKFANSLGDRIPCMDGDCLPVDFYVPSELFPAMGALPTLAGADRAFVVCRVIYPHGCADELAMFDNIAGTATVIQRVTSVYCAIDTDRAVLMHAWVEGVDEHVHHEHTAAQCINFSRTLAGDDIVDTLPATASYDDVVNTFSRHLLGEDKTIARDMTSLVSILEHVPAGREAAAAAAAAK